MTISYGGSNTISSEEEEELSVDLTHEETQAMIKRLHYASNGFSVIFSCMFNIAACHCDSMEEAEGVLNRIMTELRAALARYYNGELDHVAADNGVKTVTKPVKH